MNQPKHLILHELSKKVYMLAHIGKHLHQYNTIGQYQLMYWLGSRKNVGHVLYILWLLQDAGEK